MYNVLFLLRSLNHGGVERQVIELVKNMNYQRFDVHVVTFYDGGALKPALDELPSVQVYSLSKKGRWDFFGFWVSLFKLFRQISPDVVQTYLDVPNSYGLIVGKLVGAKISLGVSASYIDFSKYDWTRRLVYNTGAMLSRFADVIIANSHVGKTYNTEHGYSAKNMIVIPNGIDTNTFFPDVSSGMRMRARWGIGQDEQVIGIVGRLDAMKDHQNFLQAAALVFAQNKNARFVCIGRGLPAYVDELKRLSASLLPEDRVLWVHDCEDADLPPAYNAFDVLVSSSYGEGLPVVIGEGMACGLPCVVTDVGDSALAVGDAGFAVPARDAQALADAICAILNMPVAEYERLSEGARKRVLENYSINMMASAYEAVYASVAKK